MKQMELLTTDDIFSRKKGIFEKWVCNREHLDKLLKLGLNNCYSVDIKEFGSKAERPTGCVYGLNKIFVAGHLPLKAEENGENVIIKHTGSFDEYRYATKIAKTKDCGRVTSYEQPSTHQLKRVQNWLVVNGYKLK